MAIRMRFRFFFTSFSGLFFSGEQKNAENDVILVRSVEGDDAILRSFGSGARTAVIPLSVRRIISVPHRVNNFLDYGQSGVRCDRKLIAFARLGRSIRSLPCTHRLRSPHCAIFGLPFRSFSYSFQFFCSADRRSPLDSGACDYPSFS